MLEGLKEVKSSLENRGIGLVVRNLSPETGAEELARSASTIIVDRGYTKLQRSWRKQLASRADCPVIEVEGDVVVPIAEASIKEEYSAATLRPKIARKIEQYLVPLKKTAVKEESAHLKFASFQIDDTEKALSHLNIDRSVRRQKNGFHGGTSRGKALLEVFIENKLNSYHELRNDPTQDATSHMSPYLHFGQISPLYIALKIDERKSPGKDAYLEELIVRRELAINFVYYNEKYDSFEGIPNWCRKTLKEHEKDEREQTYSREDLEDGRTHDPYWNAAQREMVITGKMHGYMRMYWGKKIIEWTEKPEEAFRTALYLNNKYEIDGRDPNGFTGVAWCFGKHDRPWSERPVFGKIRYMNDRGLRRKFDADGYVKKIDQISS
jgi:deoxyribodipyrimidine photo-lyase